MKREGIEKQNEESLCLATHETLIGPDELEESNRNQ